MGLPAGCVNKGLKYAALALSGACLSLHLISGSRMMAMAAPSTHPKQKWQLSLLKLEFLGPENWVTIVEKRAERTKKVPS